MDRDGTLVPYQKFPEDAVMPEETRDLLKEIAALPNVWVAIVSARGNVRLKKDVDDREIILAGNYGMEMRLQDGQEWVAPGALQAVPELRRIHGELASIAQRFQGSILEDDYYSYCLHWHLVSVEDRPALHEAVLQLKQTLSSVSMRQLPTSYEFMPNMPWNKGNALDTIASLPQFSDKHPYFVYMGDTDADEPAFEWANTHGGSSVRVGALDKGTKAKYRLPEPADIISFLESLLKQRSILSTIAYDADEDPVQREKKIEAVFNTLKKDYAKGLADRIKELQALVAIAIAKPDDPTSLTEARTRTHRIRGTIGSYGFTEISALLGDIEAALETIEKTNSSGGNHWKNAIPIIEDNFAKAIRMAKTAS
jgi:trehalose-phosphatase